MLPPQGIIRIAFHSGGRAEERLGLFFLLLFGLPFSLVEAG